MAKKKSNKSAIRTETDKKVPAYNRAVYSTFNPLYGYPNIGQAALGALEAHHKTVHDNQDKMNYLVEDSVADAGWRKRVGLSYDNKWLIDNEDGSVRLPKDVEARMPVDTTALKKDIAYLEDLLYSDTPRSLGQKKFNLLKGYLDIDKANLEALRTTFKTGKPVVLNSGSYKGRKLINDDNEFIDRWSPLNILENYTVQYNPKTNTMDYRDTYDFNGFESFVPGEPFEIKGSIPLQKYDIGGWLSNIGSKLDGWNSNATDKFLDSGIGKGLSSFGIKSGNIGGIANTAATAIGGLLAGKNSTGVGKAMQSIGSLASNIPGVGGLIGAGVNLAGGLVNAAFGSNLNEENIAQVEGDISKALNFTSNAGDYDALSSNYSNLQGVMGFNKDFIGSDGWFSNKAKKKFRALRTQAEEAEQQQFNSLFQNKQNIAKTNQQLMEANYNAYGGNLNKFNSGGAIANFINSDETIGGINKALYNSSITTGGANQGIQNNLGRNDGSGWFGVASKAGMATYDIINTIRNLTKSNRTPIENKIGLYSNGGKVDYMGMAESAVKLVGNAINEANNLKDTTQLEEDINNHNNFTFSGSNDDLMNQWSNTKFLTSNVTTRDIRDKSYFDDFLTSVPASFEGFNAGSSAGPWGAAIGGIVGGASSVVGSLIGRNKASKKAAELNSLIDENNQRVVNSFSNAVENNNKNMNMSLLSDFFAYGGPIDMKYTGVMSPFGNQFKGGGIFIKPSKRGTFTAAAKKRGMGVQEFASKVLANKEDYSPAMVKKANFARNASKWKHDDGGLLDLIRDSVRDTWDSRKAFFNFFRGFPLMLEYGKPSYGGGNFGGGGASSVPTESPDTYSLVKDTIWVPYRETFNEAFRKADNAGLKEFMFNGISYTTEKGDNPDNVRAGEERVVEGIIPIERTRKVKNKKAEGGELFTNGVTIIGNGDTHENNPLEGVPMGVDNQGIPNLVEEGEVIFDDYVFSNRLRVPKAIRQKYKLRGVTFADIAKQVQKESEERPNDPIAKDTMNVIMSELMQEQEMVRAKRNKNRYANGGNLFPWGGNKLNPYGYDSSYNAGNWFVDNAYTDDYFRRVDAMTVDDWNQHLSDQLAYYTDTKNKGTARYNVIDYMYAKNPWMKDYIATEEDLNAMRKLAKSKPGFMHPMDVLQRQLDAERKIETVTPPRKEAKVSEVPASADNKTSKSPETSIGEVSMIEPIRNNWLRYAPIIGSGIAVFNDLFGGNEPDYSNANMYQKAIDAANREIKSRPIGNYLRYTPFDRNYYINQLNANTAAGRRAVANTSGGNRAAALAGLLATDYNYGNQLGQLARQAEEYNLAQRQQVEDFNRATNMYNSEVGMKADMANAEQAIQRAKLYSTLASMRQGILNANRAEKSANLTNFIQGLGDLGRELTDKDMLRWLTEKGVLKSAYGGKIKRKKRGGFTI